MRVALLSVLLLALPLAAADISGKWTGTVEVPAGTFPVWVTLEQKGDEVGGSISAEGGVYSIQRGKLSGNTLTFEVYADQLYAVECTIENGSITGTVKPAQGGKGRLAVKHSEN